MMGEFLSPVSIAESAGCEKVIQVEPSPVEHSQAAAETDSDVEDFWVTRAGNFARGEGGLSASSRRPCALLRLIPYGGALRRVGRGLL